MFASFLNNAVLFPLLRRCGVAVALLLPFLAHGADSFSYEFWSCDQSRDEINVLSVPLAYKPSLKPDQLITTKKRPAANQTFVVGQPVSKAEAHFSGTHFFATYPDFNPIETATSEEKRLTEAALINPEIPSGEIFLSGALKTVLGNRTLEASPASAGHRKREESLNGLFWVYGDPWLRRGQGSSDRIAYFVPKDAAEEIFFECRDEGKNILPTGAGRCQANSILSSEPSLKCLWVMYRIPVDDVPRWRQVDGKVKAQIRKMLSVRLP